MPFVWQIDEGFAREIGFQLFNKQDVEAKKEKIAANIAIKTLLVVEHRRW